MIREAAEDLFQLDGKVPRTLWLLVRRPGFLTVEYFAGRRARYARPLGMFLLVSIVFFLLQPHTKLFRQGLDQLTAGQPWAAALVERQLAETGEPRPLYRARFNAVVGVQRQSAMLLLIPTFALLLRALHRGPRAYFVKYLVFSVHFFAFTLIFLLGGLLPLFALLLDPIGLDKEELALGLWTLALLGYLYLGLRRLEGQSRGITVVKSALLATAVIAIFLGPFRHLVFLITYLAV